MRDPYETTFQAKATSKVRAAHARCRSNAARHVPRLVTGGRLLSVTARDATGAAREVQVEPQRDAALLRFDSEPAGLGLRIHALH